MTDATLQIDHAGPLVSLQDAGRTGGLRFGVSPSGAMDRAAAAAANAAIGNPAGSTVIEVSLGGIALTTDTPLTLAMTGGAFGVDVSGTKWAMPCVLTLEPGQSLTLRGGAEGSWAYLAMAGTIVAPSWMGSTARHSKSGLGSPALTTGSTLRIEAPEVRPTRLGNLPRSPNDTGPLRVVMGPQDQYFTRDAVESFLTKPFRLSPASDRMGLRLEGPPLPLTGALSIPSEPILRGSVQVSGDGVPTVLMADHQSTGGYPKIATVISVDTDRLAQMRAGQTIAFAAVTPHDALSITRQRANQIAAYLADLEQPRGTLAERLMRENLIHAEPFDTLTSNAGD
ncbi:biotin-dependent carboxyltransferase family protein [Pseudooctadecabacter sp.]|uniref:5-oxoprolinase subunit C family protein n=1 Tax=Pseudooctadecabacter sp. TaxID=1966338 RepID=UPI0025E86170|nr:biotin-dependent carboxyltransferase family protein [Pseudooctadecabacter sp.]